MKKAHYDNATQSTIHMLHRASQQADDLFARKATGLGLTARQFVVMAIVAECDDPSQTILCDKSGIDRSTLADIVARLVSRGLLSRRRTRLDGRKYAVRLTEAGRKALEHASPIAQEVDGTLLRALTADQRTDLEQSLGRILAGKVT